MSISRQNLTVIIVSFKSENVIHDCIQSIDKDLQILIIDNSNNKKFKQDLENKYKNVSCILSEKNLGMGSGNNLGIKNTKTDFVFILNPDVILKQDTINELIKGSEKLNSFSIIAPLGNDKNYPNYKLKKNSKVKFDDINPFKVISVDGYAMLMNLKRIKELEESNYFDEKFFMYLENDDLCKRVIKKKGDIYIIPKSKINHLGGKAVDEKYRYEVELSRNWHWRWSKFYFHRKHYGYLYAFINGTPSFLTSFLKYLFFLLSRNNTKKNIYLQRMSGFVNALLGKSSHYRPKINF